MNNPAFIICWIVLLIFGITLGYKLGFDAGTRADSTHAYWKFNVIAALVGVVLIAAFGVFGLPLLQGLGFGAIAGSITGLKFGYGESVGPWRKHDDYFNVNSEHRRAADEQDAKHGAKAAPRSADEAEPQLISVKDTKANGSKSSRE